MLGSILAYFVPRCTDPCACIRQDALSAVHLTLSIFNKFHSGGWLFSSLRFASAVIAYLAKVSCFVFGLFSGRIPQTYMYLHVCFLKICQGNAR